MRTITHTQYEELVGYEDRRPRWRYGPPAKSLTRNGLLEIVPGSGHDRSGSMFRISDAGLIALRRYRDRWGIKVAALSQPDPESALAATMESEERR